LALLYSVIIQVLHDTTC